jgi:hypothetical protein
MLPAYRFIWEIRQFGRPFVKKIIEDAMIPKLLQYENCKFVKQFRLESTRGVIMAQLGRAERVCPDKLYWVAEP